MKEIRVTPIALCSNTEPRFRTLYSMYWLRGSIGIPDWARTVAVGSREYYRTGFTPDAIVDARDCLSHFLFKEILLRGQKEAL